MDDDHCLRDLDVFEGKFRGVFESVNDAFLCRDIHFSWVDVKCDLNCDESGLEFGFFESGIKVLGWGYCSTDSIVLGSALVPFGLVYPRISFSSNGFAFEDSLKRVRAQLSLEILDASGKPLECRCCDLEVASMNTLSQRRCDSVLLTQDFMNTDAKGSEQKNTFWGRFSDDITKLRVNSLHRSDRFVKLEGYLSSPILIHEHLGESWKDQKDSSGEFYADRVLEMLANDMGELVKKKSVPIWQIFLSFLYREGYWALVSFSDAGGDSCMGILKPFTVSSALFFVLGDKFGVSNAAQFSTKIDNENCKPSVDSIQSSETRDSQSGPSLFQRKKSKRNLLLLKDLSWSAFYQAAFEHSEICMEDVYFARGCDKSKKLKFLRCWMKQIKKSGCCNLTIPDGSKAHQGVLKDVDNRLTDLPQESEQPIYSSASMAEDSLTGSLRLQDEGAIEFSTATLESFFSNLPKKIQQGLQTEVVDLGALAERLVNSSIYWLYQKRDIEISSGTAMNCDDTSGSLVAVELAGLLLGDPKDLVASHKKNDPSSQASDSWPHSSGNIVREYELQIFFRMEILRSEIGAAIEEPTKQKFVKQICFLLEAIQCHLDGGFFGDWSLENYVGKTIRSRYSHTVGDVVHRIYTKMDLLLFADEEDESPNHLLNSEDSNQSLGEKQRRDETGENYKINELISVKLQENNEESPQENKRKEHAEHARKLVEAQERRERARRFSSFTSWVPDLQRVWAPKQTKAMKVRLRKLSKRNDSGRVSYDMVCETPMTGNKRSCPQEKRDDGEDHQDYGTQSSASVPKALFQD
ncbi:hypothetical protein CFOL_v3_28342 [Cephalotus follicularis]|uniref:Uncharacterized protein n=1 Tax=Cephalotus follicularis TaxID=3775 RepID=A0A1Q3CXC7_CEPFO|nr:hypothetical protein CFOL_v3_28342 [Cephalotus follicularis]